MLTVLSAIVVFCTTYALILPAITMEETVYCGYESDHTDACYEEVQVLVCDEAETVGHVHGDECYELRRTLSCTLEETDGHTHTDECRETRDKLICKLAEDDGHTHSDKCYETRRSLICKDTDPEHVHDDECYRTEKVCVCGQEERSGHHHGSGCYEPETVLVCGKSAVEPHHHDESCYTTEKILICTEKEQKAHQHTDECYKTDRRLICGKQTHEHTLQCYSNPEADIEDESVWERLTEIEPSDEVGQNVIEVAKSQLGYDESTKNYMVDSDGTTKNGYTRYGDWYGDKYGDWSAMFCSFCLNYAGISEEDVPFSGDYDEWIEKLEAKDLYRDASYEPVEGDIAFLKDGNCGIVVEADSNKIKVIEGDSSDKVKYITYKNTDSLINGYGMVTSPEDSAAVMSMSTSDDETDVTEAETTEPTQEPSEKPVAAPTEEPADEADDNDENTVVIVEPSDDTEDDGEIIAPEETEVGETDAPEETEVGETEAPDATVAPEETEVGETEGPDEIVVDETEAPDEIVVDETEAPDEIVVDETEAPDEQIDPETDENGDSSEEPIDPVDETGEEPDPEEDQLPEEPEDDSDDDKEIIVTNPRDDIIWKGVEYSSEEGMLIPRLFQKDYRSVVCYFNGQPKSVATSGCGAASMSMVIAYLTGNTEQNPYILFRSAVETDQYCGNGLSHETLTWFADNYDVHSKWIDNDANAIRDALKNGKPVIAHMGEGNFTNLGHYIVLRGVTKDGKILVNDPASLRRSKLAYPISLIVEQARSEKAFMVCWVDDEATLEPTEEPTVEPTDEATFEPNEEPTVEPTEEPTIEPDVEQTEEPIDEQVEEEYFCGLIEHTHTEDCFGDDGEKLCGLVEHTHTDDCLIEPAEDIYYYCGKEEHTHTEDCFDENGEVICGLEEHVHTDECLIEPAEDIYYYCGKEEHTHTEDCFDENGEVICELEEHVHTDDCLIEPVDEEPVEIVTETGFVCGLEEHAHTDDCFDENGDVICGLDEHNHVENCLILHTEDQDPFGQGYTDGLNLRDKDETVGWKGSIYSGAGMPIPRLFQIDYRTIVCTVDGIDRSAATSGSGATSASMVVAYLTGNKDQNPYTMFYDAAQAGYYGGSGLSHDALTALMGQYGVNSEWIANDQDAIIEALQSGKPVIAHMGAGEFAELGHYIVLRGMTDDGMILVNDPACRSNCDKAYQISVFLDQARTDASFMVCWSDDQIVNDEIVTISAYKEGSEAVLTSEYTGSENYVWQWQCSEDAINWVDISGAIGPEFRFVAEEIQLTWYYRIWGYPESELEILPDADLTDDGELGSEISSINSIARFSANAADVLPTDEDNPVLSDPFDEEFPEEKVGIYSSMLLLGDYVDYSTGILLVTGSDFQDPDIWYTSTRSDWNRIQLPRIKNIMTQIKSYYNENAYGFISGGDYGMSVNTSACMGFVMDTVKEVFGNNVVFRMTQGNHDNASNGESATGPNDTDYYGVFVINEDAFPEKGTATQSGVQALATSLKNYLDAKVENHYDKPVFVVSHLPIHFNHRVWDRGDAKYAKYLFDELQNHADDLNIIFLFGHCHSGDDDPIGGSATFFTAGDKILIPVLGDQKHYTEETLKFTYMNYGFTGCYYSYWENDGRLENPNATNADHTLTMTSFKIAGDNVEIRRWDENGQHVLKHAGDSREGKVSPYSVTEVVPVDSKTVSSPQYIHGKSTPTVQPSTFANETLGVTVVAIGTDFSAVDATGGAATALNSIGATNYAAYSIAITDFEALATITLPAPEGTDTVWFIGENGPEEISDVTFADGYVTFTTDTLGIFAVGTAYVNPNPGLSAGEYWLKCTTADDITEDATYLITYGTNALGVPTGSVTNGVPFASGNGMAISSEMVGTILGDDLYSVEGDGVSDYYRWRLERSGNGYKIRNVGNNDAAIRFSAYYAPNFIYPYANAEVAAISVQPDGTWLFQRQSSSTFGLYSLRFNNGTFVIESANTNNAYMTVYRLMTIPECSCSVHSLYDLSVHADDCERKVFAVALADESTAQNLYELWNLLPVDVQNYVLVYLEENDSEKFADINYLLTGTFEPVTIEPFTIDGVTFTATGLLTEDMSLSVSRIEDTSALNDYIDANCEPVEGDFITEAAYDIKILQANGQEATNVPVTMTVSGFDTGTNPYFNLIPYVYHFVDFDAEDIPNIHTINPAITLPEAMVDENGDVVFSMDSCSVFEFKVNEQNRTYTMPENGSILLSQLFTELQIPTTVDQVASVVFSDPTLISVENVVGDDTFTVEDYRLTALLPYNWTETLTITFADTHEMVISVKGVVSAENANYWQVIRVDVIRRPTNAEIDDMNQRALQLLDPNGKYLIVSSTGYAIGVSDDTSTSAASTSANLNAVLGHDGYFTSALTEDYWWTFTPGNRSDLWKLTNVGHPDRGLRLGSVSNNNNRYQNIIGSTANQSTNILEFPANYPKSNGNYVYDRWTIKYSGNNQERYLSYKNGNFANDKWDSDNGYECVSIYKFVDGPYETQKSGDSFKINVYAFEQDENQVRVSGAQPMGSIEVDGNNTVLINNLINEYSAQNKLPSGAQVKRVYYGTEKAANREGITSFAVDSDYKLVVNCEGDSKTYEASNEYALYIEYYVPNSHNIGSGIHFNFKEPDHHKFIDALRDNDNNPDTDLDDPSEDPSDNFDLTDLYRLYLTVGPESAYKDIDLLLIIDQSSSMFKYPKESNDAVDILGQAHVTRRNALKSLINGIEYPGEDNTSTIYDNSFLVKLAQINGNNRVAMVGFDKEIRTVPGWGVNWLSESEFRAHPIVDDDLVSGTNYIAGLRAADQLLRNKPDPNRDTIMIFFSDGEPTQYYADLFTGNAQGSGSYTDPDTAQYTEAGITQFRNTYSQDIADGKLTIFTVGIGDFDSRYLSQISGSNSPIMSADFQYLVGELEKAITEGVGYYSNLVVDEVLSDDVEFYEDNLDLIVDKVNSDDPTIKTRLYEEGEITEAGDGVIRDVVKDTRTGADGEKERYVRVEFEPDYTEDGAYYYSISFNVKTKESAYEKYINYFMDANAENGYNGKRGDGYHDTQGEPETDYPGTFIEDPESFDLDINNTSSDWPGFFSNKKAILSYTQKHTGYPDIHDTTEYRMPVVQVSTKKIKVDKVWSDSDTVDHSGDSVVVRLYMNGQPTPRTVTLNAANGWHGEFEVLSNYENAEYSIVEEDVPNYTPSFGHGTKTTTTTVTEPVTTYEPYTEEIITWVNQTGPSAGTFAFVNNGYALTDNNGSFARTAFNSENVLDEQQWTITKSGNNYIIRNVGTSNYIRYNNLSSSRGIELNSTDNTGFSLSGGRILYDRGRNYRDNNRYYYIRLNNNNFSSGSSGSYNNYNSAVTFTMWKKNVTVEQGTRPVTTWVTREVTEVVDDLDSFIVTNTPDATISVNVSKVWSDGEEAHGVGSDVPEIMVTLLANNVSTDQTRVLNAGNNWQASFENLPKEYRDEVTGEVEDIVYSVVEDPVDLYTVSYGEPTIDQNGNYTIVVTNTKHKTVVLKKVTDSGANLAGATFDLYQMNGNQRVDVPNCTDMVSGNDGVFSPANLELPVGTYYLEETLVPEGYNGLSSPAVITVTDEEVIVTANGNSHTYSADNDSVYTIEIVNTSGYMLPETGGIGTALYYALGALLIAGALMYGCMMRRKREGGCE